MLQFAEGDDVDLTITTRLRIKLPGVAAAMVLAVCAGITLLSSGAAAAQCSTAGLPEGKMPKPTAFAEFLSPEVWTVTTLRAQVTTAAGLPARTTEDVPEKIAAEMYDRDGWIAQELTYLRDGRSDRKMIYQRKEELPPDGVLHYSASNLVVARETMEITADDCGNAVITRTLTDADGGLKEVRTIMHDGNGWEVLATVTDGGGRVQSVTTTTRREDGRPTLIEVRDGEGTVVSRTTREYDERGALLTETVWTPEETTISTFESDVDLNWVVKRNYRMVEAADGGKKNEPVDVLYRFIVSYG